jgi:tetratricopeptide (TPR) repeat protein
VSARHKFEVPPPIEVVRPGLPSTVTSLLDRLLSKVAADRIQDAAQADSLIRSVDTTIAAQKPRRRLRTAFPAVAAGLLFLGFASKREFFTDDPSPLLAVLPLKTDAPSTTICGTECSTLVDDAMGRWPDLPKIDQMRVSNATSISGRPARLSEAEAIARALGAGRFIWGDVFVLGDSLRVRLQLYHLRRIGSRNVRSESIDLPLRADGIGSDSSGRVVARNIRQVARRLVAPASALGTEEDSYETESLLALQEKLRGDARLAGWDIAGARRHYEAALALDPVYPQVQLQLAQLGQLLKEPPESWSENAIVAAASPGKLTLRQQAFAEALEQLALGHFSVACPLYRAIVEQDSTSFQGWFGLGDCLARDPVVIPDASSPSRLGWRSSYAQALVAYDRALQLLPEASQLFSGPALSALMERYHVASNQLRRGQASESSPLAYLAFPVTAGDTIGFIPRPAGEILDGLHPEEHPMEAMAVTRRALARVTGGWATALPANQAVWRAHGLIMELLGSLQGADPSTSAIAAIRRARSIGGGAAEALDLGTIQVRLLIKMDSVASAQLLADSLLEQSVALRSEEFLLLAGLAAMRGDITRAVGYARKGADKLEYASPVGETVAIDSALKAEGAALLIHAVVRSPQDTLDRLRETIVAATGGSAPTRDNLVIRTALLERPTLFGFPALGPAPGTGALQRIEQDLAAGRRASAREGLLKLGAMRAGQRTGDRGIEGALLESRLFLLAGDTARSKGVLLQVRRNMNTLGQALISDLAQAASLGAVLNYSP